MASKLARVVFCAILTAVCGPVAPAADSAGSWLAVEFPHDSPVLPVSFRLLGPANPHVRGVSLAIDLHASLLLRNTGAKPLSGVTLSVEAQSLAPSGRGSVTIPSLHVEPGEVFPVRIDMQLLRPFNAVRPDPAGGA